MGIIPRRCLFVKWFPHFLEKTQNFFEKGIAFSAMIWYNIMRLSVPLRARAFSIRRCIEVVITVSTRNRVASKIARGFESHRLRQSKRPAAAGLFALVEKMGEFHVQAARKRVKFNYAATEGRGEQLDAELARRGSESLTPRQSKKSVACPRAFCFPAVFGMRHPFKLPAKTKKATIA